MSANPREDWRDWSEERKRAFLDRLRLRAGAWDGLARSAQCPPPGDWYLWALVGGRGSGKTRAGVEWLAEELLYDPRGAESAIVAPTFSDARDTCVEGESGLLKRSAAAASPSSSWARATRESRG